MEISEVHYSANTLFVLSILLSGSLQMEQSVIPLQEHFFTTIKISINSDLGIVQTTYFTIENRGFLLVTFCYRKKIDCLIWHIAKIQI